MSFDRPIGNILTRQKRFAGSVRVRIGGAAEGLVLDRGLFLGERRAQVALRLRPR